MNTNQRAFYFDTSAVRSSGGRLSATPLGELATSALTLVELMNGLRGDEGEFGRRQNAIRRVLKDSAVRVIWELPEQRLSTCFAEFQRQCDFEEQRIDPLRQILDVLLQQENRAEFLKAESALNVQYHLDCFENFDTSFGDFFRVVTEEGNRQIRRAYEQAGQKGSFSDFCIWFRDDRQLINRSCTILALAHRSASMVAPSPTEKTIAQFHDSYDGSIDRFVDAFSYSAMSMASDMSVPGRNDALDLAHFLFLDSTMELVSDDKKQREIALAVGVRAWSMTEFDQLRQ